MKKILLLIFFIPFISFSQNIQWFKTSPYILYEDIALDNHDGMYLLSSTHQFVDTVFIEDTIIVNNSHQIIKYDTNGVFQWARGFNFSSLTQNIKVCIDGNVIYVYGNFNSTLEVDSNIFTSQNNTYSAFFLKYDLDGNYIETKIIGDNINLCFINDFYVLNSNIYLLGMARASIQFNNTTYHVDYHSDSLLSTVVLLQIDSNYNLIWGSSLYSNISGTQPLNHSLSIDKISKKITFISDIGMSDSLFLNNQFLDTISNTFLIELKNNGDINWIYSLNSSTYRDVIHMSNEILIATNEKIIVIDSSGLFVKKHEFGSNGVGNYPPKVFRFTNDNNNCYMLGHANTDNATLNNVSIPINLNNRLFVAKYVNDTIIDFNFYGSTAVYLTPLSFEMKNGSQYISSSKLILQDSIFIVNNDTVQHSSHFLFKGNNDVILSVINYNNIGKDGVNKLIKIVDILGRETKPQSNVPLFYIYNNGTVEKRIIVE
ncbi:hypothetical protein N9S96_00025 [Flavobacteriales bacterium]|jgi:hypothetical protein|nr:hypothetical protein [Flavobacteriales bacterium]